MIIAIRTVAQVEYFKWIVVILWEKWISLLSFVCKLSILNPLAFSKGFSLSVDQKILHLLSKLNTVKMTTILPRISFSSLVRPLEPFSFFSCQGFAGLEKRQGLWEREWTTTKSKTSFPGSHAPKSLRRSGRQLRGKIAWSTHAPYTSGKKRKTTTEI